MSMTGVLLFEQECSISKAGELPALAEAAGAFVNVDLKANLLSDWQEVRRGEKSLDVGLGRMAGWLLRQRLCRLK